jgi:hypothetical protein
MLVVFLAGGIGPTLFMRALGGLFAEGLATMGDSKTSETISGARCPDGHWPLIEIWFFLAWLRSGVAKGVSLSILHEHWRDGTNRAAFEIIGPESDKRSRRRERPSLSQE